MQPMTDGFRWSRAAAMALLVALAGCGGGGEDFGELPVAEAGPSQRVQGGDTVELAGSATDPDGGGLQLAWSQVAGTPATLVQSADGTATFVAPAGDADMLLTFRLTATDAQGNQSTDEVAVSVTTPAVALLAEAAVDPTDFVTSDGRAFFLAGGGGKPAGSELWVTDGTTAGTRMVRSFAAGGARITGVTPYRKGVFFAATERGQEWAAWYSDGTAAGTWKLNATTRDGKHVARLMGVYGDRFWYTAFEDACYGSPDIELGCDGTLMVSDGTRTGTHAVHVFRNALPWQLEFRAAGYFRGRLYFYADGADEEWGNWDANYDAYLFATDGSPGSMVEVMPRVGYYSGVGTRNYDLALYRDQLYFHWYSTNRDGWEWDGESDYNDRIYAYDGATARLLFDAAQGVDRYVDGPLHLQAAGGRLLFSAYEPAMYPGGQRSLWASDGTPANTRVLARIELAPDGEMFPFNGRHYFRARAHGTEAYRLWSTDGTAAGTRTVGPMVTPDDWSATPRMAVLGNRLMFQGSDGTAGFEPWVTDGTDAGTHMLRDIRAGGSSYPQVAGGGGFTVHGGKAYFVAEPAANDFRLFETDGTAAGTRAVQAPPYATATEGSAGRKVGNAWLPSAPPVRAGQALVYGGAFTGAGSRPYRVGM